MGPRNPVEFERVLSGEARGLGPILLRAVLRVASWGQALGRAGHRWLYHSGLRRRVRLGVPVVSVGNLTAGGAGKTPFVAWLAQRLQQEGRSPVVLARGYGRAPGEVLNDEGKWLQDRSILVVQDADRVAVIQPYLDGRVDVVVLDDGFQHERLYRDLDLVLLDATRPFGFGHRLPRGLLRDPPAALQRASAIVLTRWELVSGAERAALLATVQEIAPGVPVVQVEFHVRRLRKLDGTEVPGGLPDRPAVLLTAVGHPDGVRQTVERLGASEVVLIAHPDHHRYQESDLADAATLARERGAWLVTTEKDAVKLKTEWEGASELAILVQEVAVTGGEDRLEALLRRVLGEDGVAG